MRNVDYICMQKLPGNFCNYKKTIACLVIIIFHFSFFISHSFAQFNTDRLVMIGRSALYYEDYVLWRSITWMITVGQSQTVLRPSSAIPM